MKKQELNIRKGQKCFKCKKIIKGSWCYNGDWWHEVCKDIDTNKRIAKYIVEFEQKDMIRKTFS